MHNSINLKNLNRNYNYLFKKNWLSRIKDNIYLIKFDENFLKLNKTLLRMETLLGSKKNSSKIVEFVAVKVIMQGKLIAVACTSCVHIETSSFWTEFVNKNRCIIVRLVSEEDKSIEFLKF